MVEFRRFKESFGVLIKVSEDLEEVHVVELRNYDIFFFEKTKLQQLSLATHGLDGEHAQDDLSGRWVEVIDVNDSLGAWVCEADQNIDLHRRQDELLAAIKHRTQLLDCHEGCHHVFGIRQVLKKLISLVLFNVNRRSPIVEQLDPHIA